MRTILVLGVAGLLAAPAVAADLPTLTQDSGAPVGDNQHSKTAGPEGGVLVEDFHLIEKLARFDREAYSGARRPCPRDRRTRRFRP
jgi:catalase